MRSSSSRLVPRCQELIALNHNVAVGRQNTSITGIYDRHGTFVRVQVYILGHELLRFSLWLDFLDADDAGGTVPIYCSRDPTSMAGREAERAVV